MGTTVDMRMLRSRSECHNNLKDGWTSNAERLCGSSSCFKCDFVTRAFTGKSIAWEGQLSSASVWTTLKNRHATDRSSIKHFAFIYFVVFVSFRLIVYAWPFFFVVAAAVALLICLGFAHFKFDLLFHCIICISRRLRCPRAVFLFCIPIKYACIRLSLLFAFLSQVSSATTITYYYYIRAFQPQVCGKNQYRLYVCRESIDAIEFDVLLVAGATAHRPHSNDAEMPRDEMEQNETKHTHTQWGKKYGKITMRHLLRQISCCYLLFFTYFLSTADWFHFIVAAGGGWELAAIAIIIIILSAKRLASVGSFNSTWEIVTCHQSTR